MDLGVTPAYTVPTGDNIFVMKSPFYLHHRSISWQRKPPHGHERVFPSFSCRYHPGSPEEIEGHLPEHRIDGILDQIGEPGPRSIVVQM